MKKTNKLISLAVTLIGLTAMVAALLSQSRQAAQATREPAPGEALQAVWQRVRSSGAYAFTADVDQRANPKASVASVGRQTRRDQMRVEGSTDLAARQLTMTLWSQGGSVATAGSGAQIRVENDKAFARKGEQPWQPIDDFSGLFAPEGDFMTYLVAAKNVADLGMETRRGMAFRRYRYDIDGPAYAAYMRDQIQKRMEKKGELLPSMQIELPQQYVNMQGTAEVWVGADGLPIRQILRMTLPGRDGEMVRAEVTVNFSGFRALPPANAGPILTINPDDATQAAQMALMVVLTLAFIALLIRRGRSRKVLAGVSITLIIAIALGAPLQSAQARALSDNLAVKAAAEQRRQKEAEAAKAAADIMALPQVNAPATIANAAPASPFVPGSNPPAPLPANDGKDTDGDSLTDYTETLIGTNANDKDTDADNVNDDQEVLGFNFAPANGAPRFFTDPRTKDTNGDGLDDGVEWTVGFANGVPADTDSDGTPDLFDRDNDGDNVPDNLDLSPYTVRTNIFSDTQPFELVLNNVLTGAITYVDFQVRPTDPRHLWYAYNVLDWPGGDREGTMQDVDNKTFYDVSPNLEPSPNQNGDMKLIPMLEIRITGANDSLPEPSVLNNYGIAVQDLVTTTAGSAPQKAVYVPVQLTTDERGGENVAFTGRMVYKPGGAWGNAHQVRLVWVIQALVDQCTSFGADGLCDNYQATNSLSVLQTYDDPFKVIGLSVFENRVTDLAVIYEDPNVAGVQPSNPTTLMGLAGALESTLLAGRTVTGTNGVPTLDVTVNMLHDRLNHTTNGNVSPEARWIPTNTLSIVTGTFAHRDAALFTTATTTTQSLLNSVFTPQWSPTDPITPSILFARQDVYRSMNFDTQHATSSPIVQWAGNRLTLNVLPADVPEETLASINIAPYQYNGAAWSSMPIDQYWDQMAQQHRADFESLFVEADVAGGALAFAQIYYLVLYQSVFSVVKTGDLVLQRDYFMADPPLAAKMAGIVKGTLATFVKAISQSGGIKQTEMFRVLDASLKQQGPLRYRISNPLSTIKEGLTEGFGYGTKGIAATAAVAGALVIGLAVLAAYYFAGNPDAQIATAVIVGSITAYTSVIAPSLQLYELGRLVSNSNLSAAAQRSAFASLALKANDFSGAMKVAAIVGLVIQIGIVWGTFIYAVVSSGVGFWSVAFNTLLAQTIAATILAVLQFALSLTLVGAILVGIISVIDTILSILGVGFTINGWLTQQIARAIYHFEITVDTDVRTGGFGLKLQDPDRGLINGARATVSLPMTVTATHDNPDDLRLIPYLPAFYTSSNLKSTTFRFRLGLQEDSFETGRDKIRDVWKVERRGTYASNPMYRGVATITPTLEITLSAGVNAKLPIHLTTAYALPGVECWTIPLPFFPFYVPVCYDKTIKGSNDTEVGAAIVLDALPATLDAFYAWSALGPQLDYDGDGLISRLRAGNDPNDEIGSWDTDRDGLSDRYELTVRAAPYETGGTRISPLDLDTDNDSICDAVEVRIGTDPANRDTDNDGLSDAEEVWHQNCATSMWEGGWSFSVPYSSTNGASQTLQTRLFSNPLSADEDADGLDDLAERALHQGNPTAYPYSTRVFNINPIALYLNTSDADGVVRLGQSLVVTTTVRNNLAMPLYALGTATTTLPAALGGRVFTGTFNVLNTQFADSFTSTLIANGAGPSATISAAYFARTHAGSTQSTWTWDPMQSTIRPAITPGTRVQSPSLASYPTTQSNAATYALAAVEGTLPLSNSAAIQFPAAYGSASTRHAAGDFTDPLTLTTASSGLAGATPPGIECNSAGECIVVATDARWFSCETVEFYSILVNSATSTFNVGNFYWVTQNVRTAEDFKYGINSSQGYDLPARSILWPISGASPSITKPGSTLSLLVNGQPMRRSLCQGDQIQIWQVDPFSANPILACTLRPMIYPSTNNLPLIAGCVNGNAANLTLTFRVVPSTSLAQAIRLNSDDRGCSNFRLSSLTSIDNRGKGPFYIQYNGYRNKLINQLIFNPQRYSAIGTQIWASTGITPNGTIEPINRDVMLCRGDTIDIWDDDNDLIDRLLCTIRPMDPEFDQPATVNVNDYLSGISKSAWTCNTSDGVRLQLNMSVIHNPKYYLVASVLNPAGTPKTVPRLLQNGESYVYQNVSDPSNPFSGLGGLLCAISATCAGVWYRAQQHPNVSSDGTNFLATWLYPTGRQSNTSSGPLQLMDAGLRATRVDNFNNSTTIVIPDAGPVPLREASAFDTAWVGDKYAMAWETRGTGGQTLKLRYLNSDGNLNAAATQFIEATAGDYTLPRLSYSPTSSKALLVYRQGTGGGLATVKGRVIQNSVVGSAFDIATNEIVAELDVTWSAQYDNWLVAWSRPNSNGMWVKYVPLKSDTSPLTPVQEMNLSTGKVGGRFNLSCTRPSQWVAAPNCAVLVTGPASASADGYQINRVFIREVPPWLGTFTGNKTLNVLIDSDVPTSAVTSLQNNQYVSVSDTLIIGGDAGDLSSNISLVEVSINGGSWQPANGNASWTFAWSPSGDGQYTIRTRATDMAGNVESSGTGVTVNVDNTPPQITSNVAGSPILPVTRDAQGRLKVTFTGSGSDPSVVSKIEGVVSPNGSGWQTATLSGNAWTLDYLFPSIDSQGNAFVAASGEYTLSLRSLDGSGNLHNAGGEVRVPFRLDNTPPIADLRSLPQGTNSISQSITLAGVITDPGAVASGVQGIEISLLPSSSQTPTWVAATLDQSGAGVAVANWSFVVPDGLEDSYRINLRGADVAGNYNDDQKTWWTGWQGEIDTLSPRAVLTVTYQGNGKAGKTMISAFIEDLNLSKDAVQINVAKCTDDRKWEKGYLDAAWWNEISNNTPRLTRIGIACTINNIRTEPITLIVTDLFGRQTVVNAVMPPAPTAGAAMSVVARGVPADGSSGNALTSPAKIVAYQGGPLLASTVLTPADGDGLQTLNPVDVTGGAYAIAGLKALTLTVNGNVIHTTNWPSNTITDTLWTAQWTPVAEGVYTLTSVVEDWNGALQTSLQPVRVTVDGQPPVASFDTTIITTSSKLLYGRVDLGGPATDNLGAPGVQIKLNGVNYVDAQVTNGRWRSPWFIASEPDNVTYQAQLRFYDAAWTVEITQPLVVDLAPPSAPTLTLSYVNGANATVAAEPFGTVRDGSSIQIDWTPSNDAAGVAGYRAGWTNTSTVDLNALTAYAANASPLQHSLAVPEASVWLAHVVAIDNNGNTTPQTVGPIYVDAPTTPDYINPDDGVGPIYRGWMESGCSLVGSDYEAKRNAPDGAALNAVQRMYLTWDASALRIAWAGADWNRDGDLFVYFDTTAGGAITAYNPHSSPNQITLPSENGDAMGADYLVWIKNSTSADLLRWNGSGWGVERALSAPNFLAETTASLAMTDLYLPFAWLGAASSIKVFAMATEDNALRAWATMPGKNPLNSARAVNNIALPYLDTSFAMTQYLAWNNVGAAGMCPVAGQFEDSDMQTDLLSTPAGVTVGFLRDDLPGMTSPAGQLDANLDGMPDVASLPIDRDQPPIGAGKTVNYVLRIANNGAAPATGVVVTLNTNGGLQLAGGNVINVGTLAVSETRDIPFTAQVNTALNGVSGEIKAVVADGVRGPFDWLWVQHDIDTVAPQDVNITSPARFINPFTNTIGGAVTDRSAVPSLVIEREGGGAQDCTDPTPDDGEWLCAWSAGSAANGTTIRLRAKATDEWGNAGAFGNWVTLVVDASPPTIMLNSQSTFALSNNLIAGTELPLGGTVTDDKLAGAAEVCAQEQGTDVMNCVLEDLAPAGQPIGAWTSNLPINGSADGVTYTLNFVGLDGVGNRSQSVSRTVLVDIAGPVVDITTRLQVAEQFMNVTVLAGIVRDGSGVKRLEVQVTQPDTVMLTRSLPINGNAWSFAQAFNQAGLHYVGIIATDQHDNQRILGTFPLNVFRAGTNVPPTVSFGSFAVNEGFTTTLTAQGEDLNGDVLTYAWDLDNDGAFDDATGQSAMFDARNIDGPATRIIGVRVSDPSNASASVSSTLSVINADPVFSDLVVIDINENGTTTLTGQLFDPGPADTLTVTVNWGEGSIMTYTYPAGTQAFTLTRQYLDDNPTATASDVYALGLQATDKDGGSSEATASVIVNNIATVLNYTLPVTVSENTPLTLTGQILDAGTQDTITLRLDWNDGSSPDVFSTIGGSSLITVPHAYIDNGVYPITVTVGDDDSGLIDSVNPITVVNAPPVVQIVPLSQIVQYSDPITRVVITATDVVSDPMQLTTTWRLNTGPFVAGLPVSLTLSTANCVTGANNLRTCTWNLDKPSNAFLPPGTYTVRAFVSDDDGGTTVNDITIRVVQEDARVDYTGALFASTSSASSGSATVLLAATIRDITVLTGDPAYDAFPGDIRTATVTFVNRDANNALLCTAPIGLVNPNDSKTGVASCNWAANIGTQNAQEFTVGIIVGGYYTRNVSSESVVVEVAKPLADFITGGGYITVTRSAGAYPGEIGSKMNFGFNVKFNKSMTNLQGRVNVIIRNSGRTYQIKSNSISSLSNQIVAKPSLTTPSRSTFTGKANIQDITNPLQPIAIDGNASLQMVLSDAGEPGSNDKIAITIYNKSGGLWFASDWDGAKTVEKTLAGGNVAIR